jgi:hypothetical protein
MSIFTRIQKNVLQGNESVSLLSRGVFLPVVVGVGVVLFQAPVDVLAPVLVGAVPDVEEALFPPVSS